MRDPETGRPGPVLHEIVSSKRRYLALLIKTREQSVPRAENANRPALKGSPSNMAEMAVRRLEENAVRRNRLELVEPVVAVFCR